MKQKLHSTEEIIRILRQVDCSQSIESVCREYKFSESLSGTCGNHPDLLHLDIDHLR